MNLEQLLDPELAAALAAMPPRPDNFWDDLPGIRATQEAVVEATPIPPELAAKVLVETQTIPGPAGEPDVPVRIYHPAGGSGTLPCLFWIHGGGYVLGSARSNDLDIMPLVDAVGCVVVSVDYRLAPEHPYPAGLDDCYSALRWTFARAQTLGVDPDRIAIGGSSAGAGLAAALGLLARDQGEFAVLFQLLTYPMIDDRDNTPSTRNFADTPIWNRAFNRKGWQAYLGALTPGGAEVPVYAAPARAEDLTGLPPTWLAVGSIDLFLDEDLEYARRLANAGTRVELHVYPGGYHGWYNLAPDSRLARQFVADRNAALKQAFGS